MFDFAKETQRVDEYQREHGVDRKTAFFAVMQRWLRESLRPVDEEDGELSRFLVDSAAEIADPKIILTQEETGAPLFCEGGLTLLVGAAKSRKTHLMTALCASVLGFGGFGLTSCGGDTSVVYLDTEQGLSYAARTKRKIHRLVGWDPKENNDRLRYLAIRTCTVKECRAMVGKAIRKYKPTVLFLDGLVDICGNYNDIELCTTLVRELMELAETNGTHICAVLHLNKDNLTERGTLGAIYMQKAETNIECRAEGETSQMRPYKNGGRNKAFKPQWFLIDDLDGSLPKLTSPARAEKPKTNKQRVWDLLEQFYRERGNVGRTNAQLTEYIESESKTAQNPVGLKRGSVSRSLSDLCKDGSLVKGHDGLLYPNGKLSEAAQMEINDDNDGEDAPF